MNIFYERYNASAVVLHFLKYLNVRITSKTVKEYIENHPDFPSLLSVSDCLCKFGFSNEVVKTNTTRISLSALKLPIIAHTTFEGSTILFIEKINNESIIYSNEKVKRGEITMDDFLNHWSGFSFNIVDTRQVQEEDYVRKRISEILLRIAAPLLVLGIFFLILFQSQYSIDSTLKAQYVIFQILNILGILSNFVIFIQITDSNNPLIKRLCSNNGKDSCNKILNSNDSKIFGLLSWNDIGMAYFLGLFLGVMFIPVNSIIFASLSFSSVFFILYSISYQIKKKNWCKFCSLILFILLAQSVFFGNLLYVSALPNLTLNKVILQLFCFLYASGIWIILKHFLLKHRQSDTQLKQLNRFKSDKDIFFHLLRKQPFRELPTNINSIKIGNDEAKVTLSIISNPYCTPCAEAHKQLTELMFNSNIRLNVIFATSHPSQPETLPVKHLLNISKNEPLLIEEALHSWYGQEEKNYNVWKTRYPDLSDDFLDEAIVATNSWCLNNGITGTPTVLVNGYQLPELYSIKDLENLLS